MCHLSWTFSPTPVHRRTQKLSRKEVVHNVTRNWNLKPGTPCTLPHILKFLKYLKYHKGLPKAKD